MRQDEIDSTITFIHDSRRNIDQAIYYALTTMDETQLRSFLLAYLDDKQTYENEIIKALHESKDLGLITHVAGLTQAHAQNLNNNMAITMAPPRETDDSLSASSMFK